MPCFKARHAAFLRLVWTCVSEVAMQFLATKLIFSMFYIVSRFNLPRAINI